MTGSMLHELAIDLPSASLGSNGNGSEATTVPEIDYRLVETQADLEEILREIMEDPEVAADRILAVDTETTGLDPFTSDLLLLQIASIKRVYVIDCRKVGDLSPAKRILEDPSWLLIAQNVKFDYKMLRQQAGITLANVYDTMLAERLLTAGLPDRQVSLAAIALKYLGVTLDKSVRKSFIDGNAMRDFTENQLRYAAHDVALLHTIFEKQLVLLKRHALMGVAKLEFITVAAVAEMEMAGCKVDVAKWQGILTDVRQKRDEMEAKLTAILSKYDDQLSMFGGTTFNLNSPVQLKEVFAKLGVSLEDTNENTLKTHDHEAVKLLLEYRGHEKILSAYGENFLKLINPKTGRIHPDFEQYGTDTGRFSCRNPNVQQIPATSDFRQCFVPEPGYKLVVADYSQIELRILADLSNDKGFMGAFMSDGDLHALTASQMFGIPLEEITKQKRSQAKAINFGLAYGRGSSSLAVQLEVDTNEAEKLIEQYFKAYSGVKRWLEGAARTAVESKQTATLSGRKRFYVLPPQNDPNYKKERSSVERKGKNTPIQGTSADITKYALIFVHDGLKGLDARMVNCVHDEIVVEAHESIAEEAGKILEEGMVRAAKMLLKKVPIKAEVSIADYWCK